MNPTPKTSAAGRQGGTAAAAASKQFAENFVPEGEFAQQARRSSVELGLPAVSPGAAATLTFLARTIDARAAVEIGTGAGVSGLALLEGMNPEGILTSIDTESDHQAAARKVFATAGIVNRRARLIAGAALVVLPKLSDAAYDLVFVDGDALESVEYVAQASRLLRSGGLLVLNHAFAGDTIADASNEGDETVIVREALDAVTQMDEFTPLLLPVGDGLLVATRA